MEPQTHQAESNTGKKQSGKHSRRPGDHDTGAPGTDTGREGAEASQPGAETRTDEIRDRMSSLFQRWPVLTVAVFAGLGLAAATVLGVGEVAVAGAAGYLAYRWLGKGPTSDQRSPMNPAEQTGTANPAPRES